MIDSVGMAEQIIWLSLLTAKDLILLISNRQPSFNRFQTHQQQQPKKPLNLFMSGGSQTKPSPTRNQFDFQNRGKVNNNNKKNNNNI